MFGINCQGKLKITKILCSSTLFCRWLTKSKKGMNNFINRLVHIHLTELNINLKLKKYANGKKHLRLIEECKSQLNLSTTLVHPKLKNTVNIFLQFHICYNAV